MKIDGMQRSLSLVLGILVYGAFGLHAPTVHRSENLGLRGGMAGSYQPTRSPQTADELAKSAGHAEKQLPSPTFAKGTASHMSTPQSQAPAQSSSAPAAPPTVEAAEQLSGNVEQISSGGSSRVTELAQKNRLLLQQCKVRFHLPLPSYAPPSPSRLPLEP